MMQSDPKPGINACVYKGRICGHTRRRTAHQQLGVVGVPAGVPGDEIRCMDDILAETIVAKGLSAHADIGIRRQEMGYPGDAAESRAVLQLQFVLFCARFFCRDKDDAVGAPGAVDSGGIRIFKQFDAFDIRRVDKDGRAQ